MAIERSAPPEERHFAPYAPAATVLNVIRHFRNRDVPERLTTTQLGQLSVTDNLVPRVVRALQFLGLIEEDGVTTQPFRSMPAATDDEYKQILSGLIRNAYRDIFQIIDPADAPPDRLLNAFRPYSPAGQRERMVVLFTELCHEAGMRVAGSEGEPRVTAPRIAIRRRPEAKKQHAAPASPTPPQGQETGRIHPTLSALFGDLPSNGRGWTASQRDRWLDIFRAMLDYLYPVVTDEPGDKNDEGTA